MAWGKKWEYISVVTGACGMMYNKAIDLRTLVYYLCFIYSSSPDLRFSMALCDQEKAFRQQRKENIKENMKKLLGPKNSEGLHSTRDVSWKFFKMFLQLNNNFVCTFLSNSSQMWRYWDWELFLYLSKVRWVFYKWKLFEEDHHKDCPYLVVFIRCNF